MTRTEMQNTRQPESQSEQEPTRALAKAQPQEESRDERLALIASKINAKNPSTKEIEVLRELMASVPTIASLVGDMAGQARHLLVEQMAANVVIKETILDEVRKLEERLGYQDAPAIEQILIQQIGICWLALYQTQQAYTRSMSTSMTFEQAAWQERRLSMVQGRFLRAVEALAKVRKLARGSAGHTLMLNVAQQQINAAIGG